MKYASPDEIPRVLREAILWHEVFRKIGVPADDLFLHLDDEVVAVVVRQGPRKMGVRVGPLAPLTVEGAQEAWPGVVELWNATCNSDPSWNFEGSAPRRAAVGVIADFVLAGFTFGVN